MPRHRLPALSRRDLLQGVGLVAIPATVPLLNHALRNPDEAPGTEGGGVAGQPPGTIHVYNVRDPPYQAAGDGIADDTEAIQSAITDCYHAGGGVVYLPAGTYRTTASLNLPSFTTAGNPWDENNPIRILGAGPDIAFIHYTGSDPYAIVHPTIGGTTDRGQNAGVELGNFALTGPQDFANTASGIGIDNTRRPYLHDIYFKGFPGGVGIHLYGHQSGGIFGARVEFCRFGTNHATSVNGQVLYSLDVLRQNSMRYGIWLDGPFDTNGKVNDTLITDNQMYDLLIGMVKISGHGTFDPATSDGSSANTMSRSNVYFTEAGRKLEMGTLSAVSDASTMRLRQKDVLYTTDGALNGLYLAAIDTGGRWHRRYIESFAGATREVVLAAPLPFTPDTSTGYRIGYADAQARSDFPDPIVLQHVFYWNSAYSMSSIGDYAEETIFLVAGANANSNVEIIAPVDVVNDVIYGMREDGAGFWSPRTLMSMVPRGSDETPANTVTETMLLLNPDFPTTETALLRAMLNDTGGTVSNGDVVRQGTTGGNLDAKPSANYTSDTGHIPHYIVYNNSRTKGIAPGRHFTVARAGSMVRVNSDAAVNIGDCLMPQTGSKATPLAQSALTPEYAMRVLGVAIENTSRPGLVRVVVK